MKRRGLPEINEGSMADIAFLLLIFFLVTTTMDVDSGIARKLPPLSDDTDPPQLKERNIYIVWVNEKDQLLVNENPMDINDLKDGAKKFISNPERRENLSESPEKAIISLKCQDNTSYSMYIAVQNELTKAYTELREEASNTKHGISYVNLNQSQQKEIRAMYPQKISEAEPVQSSQSN